MVHTRIHTVNYRSLVPRVSVIKRLLNLYEFAPWGQDLVSILSILDRVCPVEFFLEEMYENFVGT